MPRAFVDTTVLTDVLLKPGHAREQGQRALTTFDSSQLPVFAIKEFKQGPLANFIWMHNRLAALKSFSKALEALRRMSRTPKRYTTSTALEALEAAAQEVSKTTSEELVEKYGESETIDVMLCDRYRLAMKTLIFKAWRRRRAVTTEVVAPLQCYDEQAPVALPNGIIEKKPTRCTMPDDCSQGHVCRSKAADMKKLQAALGRQPASRERDHRLQTIHDLLRKPKSSMTEQQCRKLGDAIFVLLCPADAVLLTTNMRDHQPMAQALGKSAKRPTDIVES